MVTSTGRTKRPGKGRLARAFSGTAHAAVLGLLAVPFVGFWAGCSSPLGGDVTGYQALVGFTLPSADVEALALSGLSLDAVPSFGPNMWIALLIVTAVAGVAAAIIGGPRAAAGRLATAGIGIFAAWAAIAVAYPATFQVGGETVTTESDPGGQAAIFAVLGVALVADILGLLVRWSRSSVAGSPAAAGDASPGGP